jgi:hypothetical protein
MDKDINKFRNQFINPPYKMSRESDSSGQDRDSTNKDSNISDSVLFSIDISRNENLLEIPLNTSAFDKEEKADYSLISMLSSKRKPDIYLGNEVIKAKNYRVHNRQDKSEENIIQKELSENESVSEDGKDYDSMRKKEARYFSINNITIRCFNCNEVGHMSRDCPNELEINCIRCNRKGHYDWECPNIKCFRCNQIGHKSFDCKVTSKEIIRCDTCKSIGHYAEDCLSEPFRIKKKKLKESTCYFCNQKGHLICPYSPNFYVIEDYKSEEVELTDTEKSSDMDFRKLVKNSHPGKKNSHSEKKRNRIFKKLDNSEIRTTIFCPKCAGMHSASECNVQLRFNSFDKRREVYSKNIYNTHDKTSYLKPSKYDKNKLTE